MENIALIRENVKANLQKIPRNHFPSCELCIPLCRLIHVLQWMPFSMFSIVDNSKRMRQLFGLTRQGTGYPNHEWSSPSHFFKIFMQWFTLLHYFGAPSMWHVALHTHCREIQFLRIHGFLVQCLLKLPTLSCTHSITFLHQANILPCLMDS